MHPMLTDPAATGTAHEQLNYIGGQWLPCEGGTSFDDENPARIGEVLARFQASRAPEITRAIDAAEEAFKAWKKTALTERQRLVGEFLRLLEAHGEELARIVALENGKTIREARGEVQSALVEGRYHLHQAAAFHGQTGHQHAEGHLSWIEHAPLGVVGIISPWNYPVNVMCRKALPALLMGNTLVFKPASFTPWSAVWMAGLFAQAGFPAGVFNCVTGPGAEAGNALVADPRVRAISFTGSTEVGKRIQALAAVNLTRTQLELGGKNALIVCADADLERALNAAFLAGFGCAGQWCTSTSRILLQRAIAERFTEALTARCEACAIGDPLDEATQMGPVAGPAQFASIGRAIVQAKAEGARMVTGGARPGAGQPGDGYFIRPTVFTGVTPRMGLFREEVFGPVLALITFDTLDEALALANDSPYGLSSAIFTRDLATARQYIGQIEAGMAHVNIHTGFKEPALPFGGWKQSGYGPPENSRTGLEFFVEQKAVYLAP